MTWPRNLLPGPQRTVPSDRPDPSAIPDLMLWFLEGDGAERGADDKLVGDSVTSSPPINIRQLTSGVPALCDARRGRPRHTSLAMLQIVLALVVLDAATSRLALAQNAEPLKGFVDLHTHPLSNVAFGGKLFYGGVDVGALLPADPDCNQHVYATSEQQALGHDKSTHGGPGTDNKCGDAFRAGLGPIPGVIPTIEQIDPRQATPHTNKGDDTSGYPGFPDWPVWNDILHQKMWVEWIRRAYQGGLRVMVALAHNSKTLGDMTAGPSDYPTNDVISGDLQIGEIKAFVGRHSDFMEVAYSSADLYRIVSANKLAVIVGIEVDHIGNFGMGTPAPPELNYVYPAPPSDAAVRAEIDRLYSEGVRYIFPIHLLDNAFGGAAANISLFDVSNVRDTGHPFALTCANPTLDPRDIDIKDQANGGFTYADPPFWQNIAQIAAQLGKTGWSVNSISGPLYSPQCPPGIGQKNLVPLTASGFVAIKQMMHHAMLIDIDHMSQAAADLAIQLAAQSGYPLNSGHNGVRGALTKNHYERALRADQYFSIGQLHGMAGVGSVGLDAQQWMTLYNQVIQAMGGTNTYKSYGGNFVAGFGTDMGGLQMAMPPRAGSTVDYTKFPKSTDGSKAWNYNTDGVAHYGMLWDFLQDVKTLPGGSDLVENNFMYGADYFFHTWRIAETCSNVKSTPPPNPTVTSITPDRTWLGIDSTITITGTNFINVRSVVPADTFTVDSPTQITAHIPKNLLAGSYDVLVRTCNAGSNWPSTVAFLVTIPAITSVEPRNGPVTGGTRVELRGSFRSYDPSSPYGTLTPLSFGDAQVKAQCSATVCEVISPPATKPGPVDVIQTVVTSSTPSPADVFIYTQTPALTKIQFPDISAWIKSGAVSPLAAEVDLNGNAPADNAIINLTSASPSIVVPATVTIGSGLQAGRISLTLVPTPKPETVTLIAQYLDSWVGTTGNVPAWPPITIGTDKADIVTGESTAATVILNMPAPNGGASISLLSDPPTAVSFPVPPPVIPAGSYSTNFTISGEYSGPMESVTIQVSYNGASNSCSLGVQCRPKTCDTKHGYYWHSDVCRCEKGLPP